MEIIGFNLLEREVLGEKDCRVLYLEECFKRTNVFPSASQGTFVTKCRSPYKKKTCSCWACKGLRWGLFTNSQLTADNNIKSMISFTL